jgi:UDP-glucose 4-epimerase
MRILVTGSAGHLGEGLMRTLIKQGADVCGLDLKPSPYTHFVGSISDAEFVSGCMADIDFVLHTATLHKPHVATHSKQLFVDTNVTGTLNLLEAAVEHGVKAFIYTSTTSTFGDAMRPAAGEPAVWVTEELSTQPKNIYGVTKTSAEDLCQLFSRNNDLPCIVLRTSRFFPEADDNKERRDSYDDDNLKVNELLYRRVDIQDVVDAHLLAIEKASLMGFDRFIISATPPFERADAVTLGADVAAVVEKYLPGFKEVYSTKGWQMLPAIDRVYDNYRARSVLGWAPKYTFGNVLGLLQKGSDYRSPLTIDVGVKGYHEALFHGEPYPVE